jgi:hypothetical protein
MWPVFLSRGLRPWSFPVLALAGLVLLSAAPAFAQCVQGNCVDGEGERRYDDGSRYVGQWRDSKRHGRGTLERKDGGVLSGDWRDDEPRGYGTYHFTNRAKYAIEWTGDRPQTGGPYAWSNGGRYVGERDGREHGQGTVLFVHMANQAAAIKASLRRIAAVAVGRAHQTDGVNGHVVGLLKGQARWHLARCHLLNRITNRGRRRARGQRQRDGYSDDLAHGLLPCFSLDNFRPLFLESLHARFVTEDLATVVCNGPPALYIGAALSL